MASTKAYVQSIKTKLSFINELSIFPMMGEYVVKYKGKVMGGIYDDRLLVKNIASAKMLLPNASVEIPYPGARPMLRVDDDKTGSFIASLFEIIFDELYS